MPPGGARARGPSVVAQVGRAAAAVVHTMTAETARAGIAVAEACAAVQQSPWPCGSALPGAASPAACWAHSPSAAAGTGIKPPRKAWSTKA
jgi:hypothetical protein